MVITNAEYNKAKNAVNSQYTADSIQNYSNAYNNYMKQWLSSSEAYAKSKWLLVDKNTTPTNISTQTTGSTISKTNNSNATKVSGNVAKPEYQWSWNSNSKQSSYQNQWTGNYAYNTWTQYYEKQGWNQTYSSNANVVNSVRDAWNAKSYEEQQELLKNNPKMQETLTKYGITNKQPNTTTWVKQSPYENQWEGQYYYDWEYYRKEGDKSWANKWGWDYQDNSPERMAEIIRNLDDLSKSNPWLFSDYDTFYNAFIAWKGRSPEQEKVLNDYFNKMKQYNKYDNMSSDELWYLLAHWEPAEDYLSYLKYNDPQRYAEIQESRKKNENQIMNETYLNTVASQAGYEMWDSDFWKWNQEEMWYRDVNKDWLDDRLYHAPTEEELKLVDENNQYEQERAKLTDAYKWLQEDLTNQYPDADLSTIMLLTSDRWNKIQRALDTLAVNQTKVQWSLKYLQNERATMDDAWQKTINEIQKQYGMYYDYSPQWIAERAQAQYAATNITLDQADNGTDTQKQMALDRVLSDYYDKYWSIIQRSKSQVINDVMAYAKKNGVSLSQALEENFLKPLRAKPWFNSLNTVTTNNPDVFKIWDDIYGYWDENGNLVPISWSLGWWTTTWELYGFSDYTPISTEQKESVLDSFMNKRTEGSDWWQCWEFVNDYLQALWYDRLYDDPIDKKKAVTNSKEATVWSIAVMDSQKYPQYWHVAIVTDVQWDKVKLLESNWNNDEKVHTTRWVNKSDIAWYFDPSKQPSSSQWQLWNPDLENIFDKYSEAAWDSLAEKRFRDQRWKSVSESWVSEKDFLKQYKEWYEDHSKDAYLEILSNLDHLIEMTWPEFDLGEKASAWSWLWDVWKVYDYIKNNLTVNWLRSAREQWLKLWVLSDSDVKMIWSAASVLGWDNSQSTRNRALKDFREQLLNNNKYLKEKYKYQSAYSPNKWIKYDDEKKTFTVLTREQVEEVLNKNKWTTQKKAKTIKSLWI